MLTNCACISLVVLLIFSAGYLVPLFFGDEFTQAIPVARTLLVGALMFSIRRVLGDCIRGVGHPSANTIAEVCSWACLVPALALLAPEFGIEGVALALTIASTFSLILLCAIVYQIFTTGRTSYDFRQRQLKQEIS